MAEDKATANYSVEEVEAMAEHYRTSLFPHDRRVAGMLRQGARIMAEAKVLRAELQDSATGNTEVSKAVSAICSAMDRRGLC